MTSHDEYLAIIQGGLRPKTDRPQRVIILGAGMAGLVAAYELLRAGHDPLILEARQRVGGRILTVREPFAPGLFANMGAMRIPKAHQLTMAYVRQWGLSVSPFTDHNPRAYYHLRGKKVRAAEGDAHTELLGVELRPEERGRSIEQLWAEAIRPLADRLARQGEAAWAEISAEHDGDSVYDFLARRGWSQGAMELFGLIYNQEPLMNSAFLELLREQVGCCYRDLVHIDGGMDRLPQAFFPALRDRIRLGARVTALAQSPEGVTIHYRTAGGCRQVAGDRCIVTLPFMALRHVKQLPPFSPAKCRAIRQLHYDTAAKVFLQCRRRFWEEDEGIVGGSSVTDLDIRNIYYPDWGRETGRGLLLAGYTWGNDAMRWGALSTAERVALSVESASQVHPQLRDEVEGGASVAWHLDEYAGGAFALFDPNQEGQLHAHVMAPEGRYHFAGEHASLTHAWIQGAIESGLRAALEVHLAE